MVVVLHRPEMFRNEKVDAADYADKGVAEVIIGKHRAGPTGTVKLVFFGEHTKFENMARGFQPEPEV